MPPSRGSNKRKVQRQGYANLDEIRAEGEAQGVRKAIVTVLQSRGLAVDDDLRAALEAVPPPPEAAGPLRGRE